MQREETLIEILKGETPGGIDANSYTWQQIYGRANIVEYGKTREIARQVNVNGKPGDTSLHLGYGDKYLGATEGVEFTDGTCLVCATISEWCGTFASHDDIGVQYFILTSVAPKAKGRRHRKMARTR